jgi:hypothetical protein
MSRIVMSHSHKPILVELIYITDKGIRVSVQDTAMITQAVVCTQLIY